MATCTCKLVSQNAQAQDMVNAPKLIKAYEKVQDRMIRKL